MNDLIAQPELLRQNERLHLLINLTRQITSNLDLREVLHAISANARERMLSDLAGIALPDEASGKFRIYALDLPENQRIIREGMLISFTGAGRTAFETLKPTIASTSNPGDFSPEEHAHNALLTERKTVCNIPLVSRGRALGILRVGRTAERPYDADEVDFLRLVGGQIAIAIENALAYEEIARLKDKLAEEKHYLEEEFRSEMGFERIIGSPPARWNIAWSVVPNWFICCVRNISAQFRKVRAVPSTNAVGAKSAPSSSSIAPPFPPACLRASFSGTRRGRSPER